MKRQTSIFLSMMLLAAAVVTSCKPNDPIDNGPIVLDGMYITGEATPWSKLDKNGRMVDGINENGQATREGMFEKYTTLEANKEFKIVMVAGATKTTYGANHLPEVSLVGVNEHPQVTIKAGAYKENETFTVTESGLYQVVMDKTLGKVLIIPVKFWGVLGGASDFGWSDDQAHMMPGDFNKTSMTFSIPNFILRHNKDFKLRHGGGWKVGLEGYTTADEVRVNTNFGGTLEALVPGGDNMKVNQADGKDGKYTVAMTWKSDVEGYGFTAELKDFAEVTPLPTFGDMFLVGAGTAYGWDAPGTQANAVMHQCANSQDGLYWKILFLEANKGFKISAANWGDPNLGFAQVDVDAASVAITDDGGNMKVATSGMYVVGLDLRTKAKPKVCVKVAEVYGTGDCFGGWDNEIPAKKFTVNNTAKTLVSPVLAAGKIRIYAKAPWCNAWWAAEFNINNGKIVYRNNGGDLPDAMGVAGQKITLKFDDNTATMQ